MATTYPPPNHPSFYSYSNELEWNCVDNASPLELALHTYTHPESVSYNYINPTHLTAHSPISPAVLHGSAFYDNWSALSPRSAMDERSHPDFSSTGSRKRSAQTSWYEPASPLPKSRSPRSSYTYQARLPTPPLSPSEAVPIPSRLAPTSMPRSASVSSSTSSRGTSSSNPNIRLISSAPTMTFNSQHTTPGRRHASPPTLTITPSSSSSRYFCQHSSCKDPTTGLPIKSFSRRADLQRHETCTHNQPELFSCPRHNCIRKGENGFTRHDHLIEHRRGYHGENIPKRGSRGSTSSTSSSSNSTSGKRL